MRASESRPIRVLVVDDSILMQEILSSILSQAEGIEVVGTAPDAILARKKIKRLNPDVITLDVEMPGMDGLTFLDKIMKLRPMPVVMISGLTQENSEISLRALEIGAIDVIAKSSINIDMTLADRGTEIVEKVRAAARANLLPAGASRRAGRETPSAAGAPEGFSPQSKIVFVGASAGGVEAIHSLLLGMPANCPCTLITQHMPAQFTGNFAKRLNSIMPFTVQEATHNELMLPGHVYIAPGDQHMKIFRSARGYRCKLSNDDLVSGHRPSIDVMFRSAARMAGADAIGVILTGMGRDGAAGLLEMRRAGALTLGQDEATATIYGMPKVAFEMDAVTKQLPLRSIVPNILKACTLTAGRRGSRPEDENE